jgi:hypothetical protein
MEGRGKEEEEEDGMEVEGMEEMVGGAISVSAVVRCFLNG